MPYAEAAGYLEQLADWTLTDDRISKDYRFPSYLKGLEFAHSIGLLAEAEDHHPNMQVGWKKVELTFTTHSIHGLSMNDFIMAAKAEKEYEKFRQNKDRKNTHRSVP